MNDIELYITLGLGFDKNLTIQFNFDSQASDSILIILDIHSPATLLGTPV